MVNLLIADDESIIRRGLLSIPWSTYGIDLLPVACDGVEASSVIQTKKVDILLTDIRMPGLSGLELAEKLLSLNSSAQIIFLTGYAEFEYAHRAITLGAVDYLLKPARVADILQAVLKATVTITHDKYGVVEASTAEESQNVYTFETSGCRSILNYIMQHYNEPISLPLLAEKAHFSPAHLSRSIKKATGYTFVQFLAAVRVYQAGLLLRKTSMKIGEICVAVGISNEQYFSQVFKNNYGVTPNGYRKRTETETPTPIIRLLEKIEKDRCCAKDSLA